MARGGNRSGAGCKRGAPNKASAARQAKVAASGDTPLDYMLKVMRDSKADPSRRDDMAKAAAAYVHPKLTLMRHYRTQWWPDPNRRPDETKWPVRDVKHTFTLAS